MSQQLFFHGFSEYELQALRIPNQARGECLPFYVPYVKCMINANPLKRWANRVCEDQRAPYSHCKKIERQRNSFYHLMQMKKNNPQKFEELQVAPALASEYAPSFLDLTRH